MVESRRVAGLDGCKRGRVAVIAASGHGARVRLLITQGFEAEMLQASIARECAAGLDDVIDACAAAWTAERIAQGKAISFPDPRESDAFGLPIAIWA